MWGSKGDGAAAEIKEKGEAQGKGLEKDGHTWEKVITS